MSWLLKPGIVNVLATRLSVCRTLCESQTANFVYKGNVHEFGAFLSNDLANQRMVD